MNKEEFLNIIEKIPKDENNKCLTTYEESINVNDLANAVEIFKKIPTYNDLLEENIRQKEKIQKAIDYIDSQSPDAGVSGKRIKEILEEGNNE